MPLLFTLTTSHKGDAMTYLLLTLLLACGACQKKAVDSSIESDSSSSSDSSQEDSGE